MKVFGLKYLERVPTLSWWDSLELMLACMEGMHPHGHPSEKVGQYQ